MIPVLNAHARPPDAVRDEFKRCQKAIENQIVGHAADVSQDASETIPCYEVRDIPGLIVYPSFLSSQAQLLLLDKLLNRDLLDEKHNTNIHTHYNMKYPPPGQSFFSCNDLTFTPKDISCHKPLSVTQFLEKKLRWLTLGGQYDWTNKVYPSGLPPTFPPDIKQMVEDAFPMKAEAAIVNLYSPGDTLSLHRDVSEECNKPLVSISIGCDCIFLVGLEDRDGSAKTATLTLKSGDAVLMSGESRYAWHGVPKVLPSTCPDWLQDWPGEAYPSWKGWMSRKRINLNVRQMFD